MRAVKYYQPEERRYLQENLQCIYCGNTTAFYVDLRLRHEVTIQADNTILIDAGKSTDRAFKNILENIYTMLEKDNSIIYCANCQQNEGIDLQERLLDYCWQVGCPGCDVCGSYIDKQEMIDTCTECLHDHNGCISEEDCSNICPYYQDGLEDVRTHYNITLDEIKKDAGYLT